MPRHIEYLSGGAKEIFRGAMTVQAPLHAQGLRLVDHAHLVDRTVTAVATHASVYVDGMVEIGVVGQSMNLHPGNRLAGFPAFSKGCQAGAVGEDFSLSMAVDASLGRREVGMSSNFHKAVAVTAIHAQLFDVQCV